ncbi:hypothetical protein FisN_13Lh069 [Fistulifera solaris]|uniref:Uncharacterized protein n=1 Tax=Fistulifera solaris TaxID=1519565 RepID=A0A1Z5JFR9_FISSO|nr:hypothetical protein FisN_13Lh069 [Fistulifera solaris]|eukprot:GAX12608.1 hypothetical protein FisN_13Lh069 [Fistulifera solaris]
MRVLFVTAAAIVVILTVFWSRTTSVPLILHLPDSTDTRNSTDSVLTSDETIHSTSSFSLGTLPYFPETAYVILPNETTTTKTSYDAENHYYQIISFHGNEDMLKLAHTLMKGQFCKHVLPQEWMNEDSRTQNILVNVTFRCQDLFDYSGMGTGNFILAFYALRMIAHAVGNIEISWQYRQQPTIQEACTHFNQIALGYKIPAMRYDMRRMALALLGEDVVTMDDINSSFYYNAPPDGSVMQLPVHFAKPLYPHIELDDVVLHFRCGDLINSDHKSFGFISFHSFSQHVSSEARSIGIVTQPFDTQDAQMRPLEQTDLHTDRCRLVVTQFVHHLEERFPQARVSIRNDAKETIALTFARMILAQQIVSPISTFSVVPALATFGTGYIREPDFEKAPNWFLLHPNVSTLVDNVYLIQEPVLMAAELKKMWGDNGSAVLDWFQNEGAVR